MQYMKKYVQEATDENIWTSIKNNTFGRNKDIKDFIDGLELIDESACISLDAKWGDGKTFFVRQIEEVLKYVLANQRADEENPIEKLPSYEYLKDNEMMAKIDLKHSYLPIYYNAWMYDNHSDPLMSLLLVMTKICRGVYDTKIDSEKISKKLVEALATLPISLGEFKANPFTAIEKLQGKSMDILSLVQTEEEIRERVKGIFNDIIVERAQKLVIFIDELDRCRPSFAIEMLERIKHYFDDERVIFVVSLNKEQLIHTITNYYGSGFDATRYLNKFFDVNINLPAMDKYQKQTLEFSEQQTEGKFWLYKLAEELSDYYHLSLRDKLIYKSRIEAVPATTGTYTSLESYFVLLFVASIILLDIIDIQEKKKFLEGKSEFVTNVLPELKIYKRFINRLIGDGSRTVEEEQFKSNCEEVVKVYKYAFETESDEYYERFEIGRELKQKCIVACNGNRYH